jgi:hypothetical protein
MRNAGACTIAEPVSYVIPGGTCTFRKAGIISATCHYDNNCKQLLL